MKTRNLAFFGLGLIAGILLAPKKGEDTRKELSDKIDEIYLSAKELKLDDIKERINDLKIDVSKIDYDSSKEFVSDQSIALKNKLNDLINYLQENKSIQPSMEKAIDATQGAIASTIDFMEDKEIIEKGKEITNKVVDSTKDISAKVIETSKENTSIAKERINESINNTKVDLKEGFDKTKRATKEVISETIEKIKPKKEDE